MTHHQPAAEAGASSARACVSRHAAHVIATYWRTSSGLSVFCDVKSIRRSTKTAGLHSRLCNVFIRRIGPYWKCSAKETGTSTSVYADGRISTHADPTRGPCTRPRRPRHGAHMRAGQPWRGRRGRFVRFWASGELLGEQRSPKWEIPALDADKLQCKIWRC